MDNFELGKTKKNMHTGGVYTYVKGVDGKTYYIDTSLTFDHGWETMVFSVEGDTINWSDLYADVYGNKSSAMIGHDKIVDMVERVPADKWTTMLPMD